MSPAQYARIVAIAEAYQVQHWGILRAVEGLGPRATAKAIDAKLDEIVEDLERRRQPKGEGQLSLLIEKQTFVMPGE